MFPQFRRIIKFPSTLLLSLVLLFSCATTLVAQPGLWSSPVHGLTEVHLEKRWAQSFERAEQALDLPADELYEPLPPQVRGQLGPHAVEYRAFTVTHLPSPAAERLTALAAKHGVGFRTAQNPAVRLSWHRFVPGEAASRIPSRAQDHLNPAPVPELYLLQFAYPIRHEWVQELSTCGLQRVAYFQDRTYLVWAQTLDAITECPVAHYLSWVGSFYNTDRVAPDLLSASTSRSYELQYLPGTDSDSKRSELEGLVHVQEVREPSSEGTGYLRVTASPQALREIVSNDPDLLTVSHAGVGRLSDEQQGQIVAGNYNGAGVPFSGYHTWLANRGLLSSGNPQVVAVVDHGFDDGELAESEHHPDLRHPTPGVDRLTGIAGYGTSNPADSSGHGTMVAGMLLGYGLATGGRDGADLHYGSGISPHARLYVADVNPLTDTTLHQQALSDAVEGSAPATVANHSWNMNDENSSLYVPINEYKSRARFFDRRVFDADPNASGWQKLTLVFSAGNFKDTCNNLTWDTVASPATAKNVIAVGATSSHRPVPDPLLDCFPCDDGWFARPKEDDSDNISDVARFSSFGHHFAPYPNSDRAHNTRIKPDLVAPGNRVFSTVPHKTAGTTYTSYDNLADSQVNGCSKYEPPETEQGFAYHTYGAGTSFAAPVVSGVASLARKWMLDNGAGNMSPSLVKAALIATADDLGGKGNNGGDHRPSPRYGWGRVNLDRLTDDQDRFIRADNLASALNTGESITWTRTIDDGNVDTYITLAWTDKPTLADGDSQVALVNDLDLLVQDGVYRGNAFNESIVGTDDGYSHPFSFCFCPKDSINTVESVFIPAGTFSSGQSIKITVVGDNVPEPIGNHGQMFGLYAYNVQ